jgi:tRNA(fMet)-specific endonuclease VapC
VKYLLDTDHLSILQRMSEPEYAALSARIALTPTTDLALSIITFHEQVPGAHTYLSRARNSGDLVRGYAILSRLLGDFALLPALPFDAAAAAALDGLIAQRVRIARMDLRIASIALSRALVLLTRNGRDFSKVPGLVTEDWTV